MVTENDFHKKRIFGITKTLSGKRFQ